MGKSQNEGKFVKTFELFSKYNQVIIVKYVNVGSRQVQDIRRTLGKHNSILLIGKNTMIRRVIQTRIDELDASHPLYEKLKNFGARIAELDSIKNQISGKVGFVFTNEPVFELKPLIEANKVQTAARVGTIAPIDVTVPPGPTGMDPSQISFFHALSISTKIQKGQIEIVKDFKVCEAGSKVTNSQAVLLQKLGIRPFQYGMEVLSCYDNGSILNKQQVSINLGDVVKRFQKYGSRITSLSLGSGIVTEASVPHLILNAFKNLAAIGVQTGYEFDQLKNASSGSSSGSAQTTSAPVAQVAAQAPKQEVKEEKAPEPEEDVDMGGLFGDD